MCIQWMYECGDKQAIPSVFEVFDKILFKGVSSTGLEGRTTQGEVPKIQ